MLASLIFLLASLMVMFNSLQVTDPFSPKARRIPGKVQTGKKGPKKGDRGDRTTWHHLDEDQEDRDHLDDGEQMDEDLLGEKGLGTTWQLCEQSEAHTSFHSLLHVLVLKEVGGDQGRSLKIEYIFFKGSWAGHWGVLHCQLHGDIFLLVLRI